MNIKVLVIDKVSETFDTKRGSKTLHLLVCSDQSRPPLRNSFDYEMTPEELSKYGSSLVRWQFFSSLTFKSARLPERGQGRGIEHPRHEPKLLRPDSHVRGHPESCCLTWKRP
jgi:hypothetical protein